MNSLADEWQEFSDRFVLFNRHVDKIRSVNLNVTAVRQQARDLAQKYFREVRAGLQVLRIPETLKVLDDNFQSLLMLSNGQNATSTYKRRIKAIRKIVPTVATQIELSHSEAPKADASPLLEDERIVETLKGLVPSAALSYSQAVIDLADENRISFRGAALELREALRETLDRLAPDDEVMSAPGYAHEKDRTKPTMKQKVRFILRARGQSKSSSSVPEQTVVTVDEVVGTLTRAVYDMSSVATHVAAERKAVLQIRRYVAAVLHDILEL